MDKTPGYEPGDRGSIPRYGALIICLTLKLFLMYVLFGVILAELFIIAVAYRSYRRKRRRS